MRHSDIYSKFQQDGYVVIENFLTNEEVEILKATGTEIAENVPVEERKVIFSTSNHSQGKEEYFLSSGDKIRYFYEESALDQDGNLIVPPGQALNKIGHSLHWLSPQFKAISFGPRVQQVCNEFNLEAPVILQSMYIYKNPKIGSIVSPHQDSSFLFTEPDTLLGFWIALDDTSVENGCLSFIPGSHTGGVHTRYVRTNKTSGDLMEFTAPAPLYPSSSFIPCPVQKGSCILIHGQVVHKSEKNRSDKTRHVYTFHIMDATSKYSPDNWLQSPKGFPLIFNH